MRRNKYNVSAVEQRTFNGIVFHSKKEMLQYSQFALLLEHGKIAKLERQIAFPLYAFSKQQSAMKIGKYIADFVITELNGERKIYDSKGVKTPLYKLKCKIFQANYPDLRIVEI